MAKLLSKYNMIDSLRVLYQMEQAGPDAIFEARARDCYKNLSTVVTSLLAVLSVSSSRSSIYHQVVKRRRIW